MSDTIKALTEAVRGRVITPSERLAAVKATYDPDNLFHINQNIVPANGR